MANFESTIILKFDDEQMLFLKRLFESVKQLNETLKKLEVDEIERYADECFRGR